MTEEEIKELEIRKELNKKELDRIEEVSKDFEYLLDGEKDILLKDIYYEHLLTQEEIEQKKSNKDEYSRALLKELEDYRNSLTNISYKNRCNETKKLKK